MVYNKLSNSESNDITKLLDKCKLFTMLKTVPAHFYVAVLKAT